MILPFHTALDCCRISSTQLLHGAAVILPFHTALDCCRFSCTQLLHGAAVIPPFHAALDRCPSSVPISSSCPTIRAQKASLTAFWGCRDPVLFCGLGPLPVP